MWGSGSSNDGGGSFVVVVMGDLVVLVAGQVLKLSCLQWVLVVVGTVGSDAVLNSYRSCGSVMVVAGVRSS